MSLNNCFLFKSHEVKVPDFETSNTSWGMKTMFAYIVVFISGNKYLLWSSKKIFMYTFLSLSNICCLDAYFSTFNTVHFYCYLSLSLGVHRYISLLSRLVYNWICLSGGHLHCQVLSNRYVPPIFVGCWQIMFLVVQVMKQIQFFIAKAAGVWYLYWGHLVTLVICGNAVFKAVMNIWRK